MARKTATFVKCDESSCSVTVDKELRGLVAANQLRIASESPNVYTTDPNADWVKAE